MRIIGLSYDGANALSFRRLYFMVIWHKSTVRPGNWATLIIPIGEVIRSAITVGRVRMEIPPFRKLVAFWVRDLKLRHFTNPPSPPLPQGRKSPIRRCDARAAPARPRAAVFLRDIQLTVWAAPFL